MFRKIISGPTIWLLIIVIHATVGSCKGCNRNKKITLTPASPTDTTLTTPTVPATKLPDKLPDPLHGSTDSLYSEASTASSASSSSRFFSGTSGTSSGYASSRSSSGSSATPKPSASLFSFAGLENLGHTCYMNAVLQVIAALYPREAEHGPLKGLVNEINARPGVLSWDVIKGFVLSFPEAARKMLDSGRHEDVDEFIEHFFTKDFPGRIAFISRTLYKKQTGEAIYVKEMAKEYDNALRISFKKNENCDKYDLNELVALDMEEFIDGTVKECWDVDSTNCVTSSMEKMSAFVEKHQSRLEPMQENTPNIKNYIKQTVYMDMPSKLCVQLKRYGNSNGKMNDPVHGTMTLTIPLDPNNVSFGLHIL